MYNFVPCSLFSLTVQTCLGLGLSSQAYEMSQLCRGQLTSGPDGIRRGPTRQCLVCGNLWTSLSGCKMDLLKTIKNLNSIYHNDHVLQEKFMICIHLKFRSTLLGHTLSQNSLRISISTFFSQN